ncbi:MAG: 4Fe-4S binding protein [Planctomycetota bacterium]|nr:4Fe-4S binding protein [Planctomycetota bacterium]MCX8039452.1 4Fe-4S binding protein [Planctomycetota bacterium]MDW8373571.1 4Fe-4S binding protein [Planctomycetota bacterium]
MILAWINDIYEGVASTLAGMRLTWRFFWENVRRRGGATAVTRLYPEQPAEVVGERVRGHLVNDAARCIVCHACDKACPVDCFVMDLERTADNKPRASRFDIDLAKCIYCGLCVRACPTGSLSMTPAFEVEPRHQGQPFLFRRNSAQLQLRLAEPDMQRLRQLSQLPRAELSAEDRAWLDSVTDPAGEHLIGIFGLGYYTPEQKAAVEAERARKKAEAAAKAAAAKAAKEAAASPPAAASAAAPAAQASSPQPAAPAPPPPAS